MVAGALAAALIVAIPAIAFAGGDRERPADPPATDRAIGEPDVQERPADATSTAGAVDDSLPAEPPIPRTDLRAALLDQTPPGRAGFEFTTDFSRATISYADVISGGPSKDGIPAIDAPRFEPVTAASGWLEPQEGVLVVDRNDEVHVYPLQILMWHEIVNDVVGGEPVAVTYCPLCNTGIAFSRLHYGAVLDFGTTGRLRFSNLIMYDRQTESWFQQGSGDAVAGFWAGTQLRFVPVMMMPFGEAAVTWPDARVLSRETGYARSYGRNPYVGYDSSEVPFLLDRTFSAEVPDGSEPGLLDRVVSVEHNGAAAAVSYGRLQEEGVVNVEVGGAAIVVIWAPGTASALDAARVADGDDVGSANAFFARTTEGRSLTLRRAPEATTVQGVAVAAVDEETGSAWSVAGRSLSGPLSGSVLEPAIGLQHFWFSYAAFRARD